MKKNKTKIAADKLEKYLSIIGQKRTPWAVNNGIAPSVITRLFQGRKISPSNAVKIQTGTNGAIQLSDFYPG